MKVNNFNKLPNKKNWINNFIKSEKFKQISQEVDKLDTKKRIFFDNQEVIKKYRHELTPREKDLLEKKIDIQPFYILDFISSNSNEIIYDIGCGGNFFKKFYNIVGIDPNNKNCDIKGSFDSNFCKNYKEKFYNTFTINAIHFCSITKIEKNIYDYIDLVKENGFVYIAINSARIIERSSQKELDNLKMSVKEYFDQIIEILPYEIYFYENIIDICSDEWLNGNIKILLKKTSRVNNGNYKS